MPVRHGGLVERKRADRRGMRADLAVFRGVLALLSGAVVSLAGGAGRAGRISAGSYAVRINRTEAGIGCRGLEERRSGGGTAVCGGQAGAIDLSAWRGCARGDAAIRGRGEAETAGSFGCRSVRVDRNGESAVMKRIKKSDLERYIPLFSIILFALIIRLSVFVWVWHIDPLRIMSPDSITYERPAQVMLHEGLFLHNPFLDYRTPGYPLFIAASYWLHESRFVLMIFQILVSVGTIGLLWMIGRRWWGNGVAILAALLLAFDPASFISSQKILSETWFTFIFTFMIFAGLMVLENGRLAWAFGLGFLLALCAHIRPVALFLIWPVLIGVAVGEWRHGTPWKRIVVLAGIILAPWILLVCGWQARNWQVTGKPAFCYIGNYNLLFYVAGHTLEMRDGITFDRAIETIRAELPDMKGWSVARMDNEYRERGLRIIRENPWSCFLSYCRGTIKMMMPAGNDIQRYFGVMEFSAVRELIRSPLEFLLIWSPWTAVLLIFEGAFMAVMAWGIGLAAVKIIRRPREMWLAYVFLIGVVAYIIVLSAGLQGNYRFRVPIEPILILFSAIGWSRK